MKTQGIYERVFDGLRNSAVHQQTCLVAVNDSSVAVYPMEKRLTDIRRGAWRNGFAIGAGATLVAVILTCTLYILNTPAGWPRLLQNGVSADTTAVVKSSTIAGEAKAGIPTELSKTPSAEMMPGLDLPNEEKAIEYWHSVLRSLPDDERLLFVGTFDRYAQVLSALSAIKHPDRPLVIRSSKLRGGNYLVLVHPHLVESGFETARQRVSLGFGPVMLKWNNARRYKAFL